MAPVATIPCPNSDITEVFAPDVIRCSLGACDQPDAGAHLIFISSRPLRAGDCQAPPCMTRAVMPKREWKPDWKKRTAGKPDRGARPQRTSGQHSSQRSGPHAGETDGPVILYGWHPVKAALENPARC